MQVGHAVTVPRVAKQVLSCHVYAEYSCYCIRSLVVAFAILDHVKLDQGTKIYMLEGRPGFTDFKGQLLPATFSRKLTIRQIRPFSIFHCNGEHRPQIFYRDDPCRQIVSSPYNQTGPD